MGQCRGYIYMCWADYRYKGTGGGSGWLCPIPILVTWIPRNRGRPFEHRGGGGKEGGQLGMAPAQEVMVEPLAG